MNNRIRELRVEKGITQLRLSMELEVTQETISAYEIGKHMPSTASLIKLSSLFGVSTDYILGLSDCKNPSQPDELSEQDQRLLNHFKLLNQTLKEKAISYTHGLYDASMAGKNSSL